jgi:hypothetical protein
MDGRITIEINLDRVKEIGLKEEVILQLINKFPGSTKSQLSRMSGMSTRSIFDIRNRLKDLGKIEVSSWYHYPNE